MTHEAKKYTRHDYPALAVKVMEDILATPSGPDRWKKTVEAWRNYGPEVGTPEGPISAEEYDALQIAYNRSIRDDLKDKFGAMGEGTNKGFMREALSLPADCWSWVKAFDRNAFMPQNDNKDMLKNNLRVFMRTFPEYAIPEKI